MARWAALSAAIAVFGSLTGCDKLVSSLYGQSDEKPQITIALAPGYRVSVAGHEFPVHGLDICPEPVVGKVFIINGAFGRAGSGKYGCVVIGPGMTQVKVVRRKNDQQVTELWRVEQDGPAVRLWTPAGEPVLAARTMNLMLGAGT